MVADEEEFKQLFEKLLTIPNFSKHDEPYRLWYNESIEVDLLPFGYIGELDGTVTLHASRDFTLQMPGFKEAYQFAETIIAEEGFELKVTSLPAIIILKLISWDDRPERTKDVSDILYIIQNLYLLKIEEIVKDDYDLLEIYDDNITHSTTLVSTRYLGRKIGEILNAAISETVPNRIYKVLNRNTQNYGNSRIAEIMDYDTIEEGILILTALFDGIKERHIISK